MENMLTILKNRVEATFAKTELFFIELATLFLFVFRFFTDILKKPFEFKETWFQFYAIGLKSLPLVGITGFIMGAVLTIQSRPTLAEFGAESWLPAMVSVSIVREIGPVITALICAGKVGSGMGAELASMKVSEQIDAMEISGINPYKYLVITRVIASTLMIPLLTIYSDALGLFGSFVGVNIHSELSFSLYFTQAMAELTYSDIIPAFIKTFAFGFAIGMISCYQGYHAKNGTRGVGVAANASVVYASLMVFVLDAFALELNNFFSH